MNLPKEFKEKYSYLLGVEAPCFFDTFNQFAISGFRTNPLKETQKSFERPIPNTDWGYYGKIPGKSIEHVTGLIYSQEPAAQMVGQVAQPSKGMKVLDLAAAPGGKTTHLLSYMQNTGLLVSNEINAKRCKVLVENVERFGAQNVVVTNESSQRLSLVFPNFFDLIVLDAPCSGEGMFRKDPNAMKYWHTGYSEELSRLQKSILADAVTMLAPEGKLVYSTCTWAPEENEEIVKWLLETYDFLSLEPILCINGMSPSSTYPETAHMYPHHFKGEGQFVAQFKNNHLPNHSKTKKRSKHCHSFINSEQSHLWQEFQKQHLKRSINGRLELFGNELYSVPEAFPPHLKIKIARNGLHLGTFKKNRFEPSFALGISLRPSDVLKTVEIDEQQFQHYVSGNIVMLDKKYNNGWYQVVVDGNGLGFSKIVNNTLKNNYPKGLRFNS